MATIRKRGNKWQVQIRRQDAKPITKSFLTNSAAKRWAIQTEALNTQKRKEAIRGIQRKLIESNSDSKTLPEYSAYEDK